MNSATRRFLLFCCCFSSLSAFIAGSTERVNPHAALTAEFQKRVESYVKLREQAESGLSPLKATNSADAIAEREHALAAQIKNQRAGAKQGDIFTPPICKEFRRLMKITVQGGQAVEIRRSLRSAEPVSLTLRVNQVYPASVPLQSTPASVLENLPDLPKQLDYRVIGHYLILRDAGANLVIDFADGVVP